MRLEASVPADDLKYLRIGATVDFTVRGYDQPFQGRITMIAPQADPGTRQVPYRHRPFFYRSYTSRPGGTTSDRVYDPEGREYPALRFAVTDPRGGMRPVGSLLALSPDLQLLDTGAIACTPALPGYQCLLEPGRVRALDATGREVLTLLPPPGLQQVAVARLAQQGPLIDKALAEHRRWLEWVHWGSVLPQGREAVSELAGLEAIKRAVETAHEPWRRPSAPPGFDPPHGWVTLFPGIYLEPARFAGDPREYPFLLSPHRAINYAEGGVRHLPWLRDAGRKEVRYTKPRRTECRPLRVARPHR